MTTTQINTLAITLMITLASTADAREVTLRGMAMRVLERATVFKDKAVGVAGTRPSEVKALRFLLDQKNPADAFARVLRNGSLAGQLYALCGLYLTDRATFDRVVKRYRSNNKLVEVQHGCTKRSMRVSELVANPKGMRLKPGQSVASWLRANNNNSAPLDIVGGGYPSWFRNTPAVKFPR